MILSKSLSVGKNSTMAAYTNVDLAAATKFAQANFNIRVIRAMHTEAPWIASWLQYDIRDATDTDYFIPSKLKSVAKVVDVHITETLCNEVLSCNPNKEQTMCKPEDPASYYWVGDQQLGVQCNPSCFHTAPPKKTPDGPPVVLDGGGDGDKDDDTKNVAQMYMLNYNRAAKQCRIMNTPLVSILERPFYRSDVIYEKRLNDMPTGFSRLDISDTDATNSGITYRFNPTYCEYYDLSFTKTQDTPNPDGSDVNCEYEWWEKGLSAVLGMSLINTIKSGVRQLISTSELKTPTNLINKPDTVPAKYTLDGWRKNINTAFIVPELIGTDTLSIAADPVMPARRRRRDVSGATTTVEDLIKKFMDIFKNMAASLVATLKSKDFYEAVAIDITVTSVVKQIEKMSLRIAEQMLANLATTLPTMIAQQIGDRVLTMSIKQVVTTASIEFAVRIGAQSAIAMAKILAASASVVGWILAVGFIFDLIFQVWDPYGYSNLMGNVQPAHIMESGEKTLRQLFEGAEGTNFTFNMLAGKVLDSDTLIGLQLSTLYDTILYLNALTVNSDGLRIEKGNALDMPDNTPAAIHIANAAGMAHRYAFNESNFNEYNAKFMVRVNLVQTLKLSGVVLLVVGAVLFVVKTFVLGLVCLLIGILIMSISCLSIYQDTFVKFAYNNTDHPDADDKFLW